MKLEWQSQNKLMVEDFLHSINLLKKKCDAKEKQNMELFEQVGELRKEFASLMDEKMQQDALCEKLKADLDQVEQGYLRLKAGTLRQNDRLAELMGIQEDSPLQSTISDQAIERAVRSLVQDNKLKFNDLLNTKEELARVEKTRVDELKEVFSKLDRVEAEYSEYRASQTLREDKIRAEYAQSQTQLMSELKTAESYAEKVSSDAQVRERQLKKVQLKREEDAKKIEELHSTVARVAHEKQEIVIENERAEAKILEH